MSEYVTLPVDALRVWAGNPRKTIDQAKLHELAASIRARGVDHPVTARALDVPEGDVTHEILAGQRRFLATQIAGLSEMPVRVRRLSDDEALELAITENSARADVSPIEEAESLDAYLRGGRSIEQAADRFGRTAAWVLGRTRLLSLTPTWRERVAADRCPLRHAELLSRLGANVQTTLESRFAGRELPAFYDFERAVQLALHRLGEAPFPLADDTYPGGSCDVCPSRSDKQRDLFSPEATDEDASCLDPTCWAGKVEHRWTVAQKDARKRKLRVLGTDEAGLFGNGTTLQASRWVEMARAAGEGLTASAVSRTEDGVIVELVSREAYVNACEARRARLKAELEAKAAERGAAKKTARTAEVDEDGDSEDEATAPTIPPSAPARDEDADDAGPSASDIARLRADAELLAVALIDVDPKRAEKSRRALLRFCGLGQKPGAQAAILRALGVEGKTWDQIAEEEPLSLLMAALLMDSALAQALPGELALRFPPTAPVAVSLGPEIERMVQRYAAELDAARTAEDLGAAWTAIASEDHRQSLPALARRWFARAKDLGLKPAALRKLRSSGQAPAEYLVKEAA